MASASDPCLKDCVSNIKLAQNFHRTLSLHFDCGSETLRRYIDSKLKVRGCTLKRHMKDQRKTWIDLLKRGVIVQDQFDILLSSTPSLKMMDLTLLTLVIMQTMPAGTLKSAFKDLREERNHLAHNVKGELPNHDAFKSARANIIKIAESISEEDKENIIISIAELEKRELFRSYNNMDKLKLHQEELMVKIIDMPHEKVDKSTIIRFGLTKWVKQISRAIDMTSFLDQLHGEQVVTFTERTIIEQEYSVEEQTCKLVMLMTNQREEMLLKFCRCLRLQNEHVANLIEQSNTDGGETEESLKEIQKERIKQCLNRCFRREDGRSVVCSDVHIWVEEELQCAVDFPLVDECMKEVFMETTLKDEDSRYSGVTPSKSEDDPETSQPKPEEGDVFTDTTCEAFATCVGTKIGDLKLKEGLGDIVKHAFVEESITAKTFVELSKDELKEFLSSYLQEHSIKYGIGIEKSFLSLQEQFSRRRREMSGASTCTLRHFDTPTGNTTYTSLSRVRPQPGNMLVPTHNFVSIPSNVNNVFPFMARETTRMIAACVNAGQNGTIHFGIDRMDIGCGKVVGVNRMDVNNPARINGEIGKAIQQCFDHEHVLDVARCVRQAQVIPVDEHSFVVEIDVIPFSRYMPEKMTEILYPPKGKQQRKVFVYNPNGEIVTISPGKIKAMNSAFENIIHNRYQCELERHMYADHSTKQKVELVELLTRGNQYVTDELVPIICVGNLSDTTDERQIREVIDMTEAFLSSRAIFDFDSAATLRKQIEVEKAVFTVKKADDFQKKRADNVFGKPSPVWFYCNGYTDVNVQAMEPREWFAKRYSCVKEAMRECREIIPDNRAQFIFLVFAKTEENGDPMLEVARDAFLHTFKEECVVISESEEVVKDWKKQLSCLIKKEDMGYYFHSGLPWKNICEIMKSVFRPGQDVSCKLPSSSGHIIEMTKKEKDDGAYHDIEILSGEQCMRDEEEMSDEEKRDNVDKKEKHFYKGNVVSWWNFYYKQVAERELYHTLQHEVDDIIQHGGRKYVEVLHIQHHPGSGGSTLGRYLLWHFSQFEHRPVKKAYRCCVINNITENSDTAEQLERFRNFKDDDPKPFIALVDNKSEENLRMLLFKLDEIAYKTGKPGNLFCLVIVMNRVSTSIGTKTARRRYTLTHELNSSEKKWFESKYKELEDKQTEVKTLIAFNVMRREFEGTYIRELAQTIMQDVEKSELQMLKCLSLISAFDRDQPVPTSIFDSMMTGNRIRSGYLNLGTIFDHVERKTVPIGMMLPMNARQKMMRRCRETWNVTMSNALRLLITQRKDDLNHSGVCIVAQALAKEIVQYIQEKEKLTLEQIVLYMLEIVKEHKDEANENSKRFVRIVNSLFKTRQGFGESKMKFSDLILALQHRSDADDCTTVNERVINVMTTCFRITGDAMVGQQLARFHIHIKDFEAAEKTIKLAIEKRPSSSYLHDTYGQIHRSNMDRMISMYTDKNKIENPDAATIVNLGIKAVDKFKEGQKFSRESNDDLNLNCFLMEVQTAMTLLEKTIRFKCYDGRKGFYAFLNNQDYPVESSPYQSLCGTSRLEELRKGHQTQHHIEVSLRKLEERNYQIKYTRYVVQTDTNETLLLKLRDRFELFYGVREATQECFFKFSTGLKPLMAARIKSPNEYDMRVAQAQHNIEKSDLRLTKTIALQDDLLVYLGHEIISMTSDRSGPDKSEHEYSKLLRYSSKLLTTQVKQERPYLEAFIYYALLHWPSNSRSNLKDMCPLVAYDRTLEEWKSAYEKNFETGTQKQHRKDKAKTYFALGQGSLGKELVDVELLKKFWRDDKKQAEGRCRKHVLRDKFWKEPYVEQALERLSGTLDDSGNVITYKATNYLGSYNFNIHTYIPYTELSNRKVSFVLGFRWNGLTALDVEETDHEEMRRAQRQEARLQLEAVNMEVQQPSQRETLNTERIAERRDMVSTRPIMTESVNTETVTDKRGGATSIGTLVDGRTGQYETEMYDNKVETIIYQRFQPHVNTSANSDQRLDEDIQMLDVDTEQALANTVQVPSYTTEQRLAEGAQLLVADSEPTTAEVVQACNTSAYLKQDQSDDRHHTEGASASKDSQQTATGGAGCTRDGDDPETSGLTSKQRKNQRKNQRKQMRKKEKRERQS